MLTYRGHMIRRPITNGVVVGAFWDQREPAALPMFSPTRGALPVTLEFIAERVGPTGLDQELPRIERFE